MAFFLGCDVSKNKVDLALVDQTGATLWTDGVSNQADILAACFLTVSGAYPEIEVSVVVESTACYHHPVCEAAYATSLDCRVLNPLVTKQQLKATVRGKKTDKTDAVMIARLGLRGEGGIYWPESYRATKYYARAQQKLGTFAQALKLYDQHITQIFNEELGTDSRMAIDTAQTALLAAKSSLAKDAARSMPDDLARLLQTIPGVGPVVCANLIGEIQNMQRFATSKTLIAYAGLDPKIRQSGHTLNSTGRLTKRGSPHLRRNLFIAASVARQHDPYFKNLYERKRSEGKSYTVAVCAVSRKLLAVVRAIWMRGSAYNPNFKENS